LLPDALFAVAFGFGSDATLFCAAWVCVLGWPESGALAEFVLELCGALNAVFCGAMV
jgi:hypothetical protein